MPLNSIMEISELRTQVRLGLTKPFREQQGKEEIETKPIWIIEYRKHGSKKWEELRNTFDKRSEAYKFIADVYEQIEAEELKQSAEMEVENEALQR